MGLFIAFATLFKGTPDLSAFSTPIIGLLISYLDIKIFLNFLTTKTEVYTEGFKWYTTTGPYKSFFPFSLYRRKVKLFSKERTVLDFERAKSLVLYSAYKIVIAIGLLIINVKLTKKVEAGMFNFGLGLFFWCSIFLLLWKRTYVNKAARCLGITENRMKELKDAMIKKMGRD